MSNYNLEVLNVLVVDDDLNMHAIVKALLNAMQITKIKFCADVPNAFDTMYNSCPDIIITDWAMRPLDGLDFTRMVRKCNTPYVPIILLTGHTESHLVAEARDAGVNEFLAKPISVKTLHSRIVSIIGNPRPFIKNKIYIGPDRRRRRNPNHDGSERRKENIADDVVRQAERKR